MSGTTIDLAMSPSLNSIWRMNRERKKMYLSDRYKTWKRFLKHSKACESPIERIALAALIASTACIVVDADAAIPHPLDWEVVIVPQAKIPPYRVDFALMAPGPRIFALECDGKEFHTDQDADNNRSLALAKHGVRVLRISGSALYRDAINSLQPILDIVRGKA